MKLHLFHDRTLQMATYNSMLVLWTLDISKKLKCKPCSLCCYDHKTEDIVCG